MRRVIFWEVFLEPQQASDESIYTASHYVKTNMCSHIRNLNVAVIKPLPYSMKENEWFNRSQADASFVFSRQLELQDSSLKGL
jgi:hypothetical protein